MFQKWIALGKAKMVKFIQGLGDSEWNHTSEDTHSGKRSR